VITARRGPRRMVTLLASIVYLIFLGARQ